MSRTLICTCIVDTQEMLVFSLAQWFKIPCFPFYEILGIFPLLYRTFLYLIYLWLVFLFYFLTLQYCIGFAIYQNESATGIHVFPILNPPPSPYHPSGSSQCTSPKHPVSCIEPGLATHFIYDYTYFNFNIHISMYM